MQFEPDQGTERDSGSAHAQDTPNSQPQINIVPPEYQQLPPPPPQSEAESVPLPRFHYGPPAPARTAPRNPFSHPMDFNYASRDLHGPSSGVRGKSHGLDLSAGPVIQNGKLQDSVSHVATSGDLSDWDELLRDFVEAHKYYPEEARERGEEGSAEVEVTMRHDGTVEAVKLLSSSDSQSLDAAWIAVFRNNKLPPLPDGFPPHFTFRFTLDYILIYGQRPG